MARDIGAERMKSYVERIHYGNMDISGGIDTFWLNSSLKISAEEQAGFMEDLVEETLPFQEQTLKTVKRIMIDNDQDNLHRAWQDGHAAVRHGPRLVYELCGTREDRLGVRR